MSNRTEGTLTEAGSLDCGALSSDAGDRAGTLFVRLAILSGLLERQARREIVRRDVAVVALASALLADRAGDAVAVVAPGALGRDLDLFWK